MTQKEPVSALSSQIGLWLCPPRLKPAAVTERNTLSDSITAECPEVTDFRQDRQLFCSSPLQPEDHLDLGPLGVAP